jgi:hypothetical protein
MAVLSDTDRAKVAGHWMRQNTLPCAFVKAAVREAVNAADDYLDNMMGSRPPSSLNTYVTNNAAAFMNNSTLAQKLDLLGYVMMRRAGKLIVEGE